MTTLFSSESRVLLADGTFQSISKLVVGDILLNKNKKVTKVTNIVKGEKVSMTEVRYENWYTALYCTGNVQVFAQLKDEEPTWVNVSELTSEHSFHSNHECYSSSLQPNFNLQIKDKNLTATYETGLLFGLYSGYGNISENELVFRFGPNESLLTQVQELMVELLDTTPVIEKDEYCFQIKTTDSDVIEFFSEFGTKLERHIPTRYFASNDKFVQGLFQGLIDYDPDNKISRFIPVSQKMAESFLVICSLLKLCFMNDTPSPKADKRVLHVYPLFVKDDTEEHTNCKFFTSILFDLEHEGWTLEVEDSEGGFIVNNVVVRTN